MSEQNILNFLPHRPPFVMIDSITLDEMGNGHASFEIRSDNVLSKEGVFSEGGLVENMAQTAGAATGLKAQAMQQQPALGFIGALKNLTIDTLPKVGQILETEVIFVQQVMNALLVEGKVRCKGQQIASCEIKIFIQP